MRFLEDHKTLAVATVAATGGALALWMTISSQRRRQQRSSLITTDFDSFLTKPIANPALQHQQNDSKKKRKYAITSFEAYLTNTELDSSQISDPTAADAPIQKEVPCCPPDAKPVTILYGTEFGFSREIAEKLCKRIENFNTSIPTAGKNKYWPELLSLADFPDGFCLEKCQVVLIACSTQGDGVPPTEVRDFCAWLHGSTAPKLTTASAGGTYFSVLALGDRSYTHFARCGKTIDARLEELGAVRFTPRIDVNKEDLKAVDGWIDAVLSKLDTLNLATAEELGWNGVSSFTINSTDSSSTVNGTSTKWTKSKPYFASVLEVVSLCNLTTTESTTNVETASTTNTLNGSISHNTKNTRINIEENEKNTVRVIIDLGDSEIDYLPGDALGIWPSNNPQDVDDLLDAAGIRSTKEEGKGEEEERENVLVQVPAWHYKNEAIETTTTTTTSGSLITLREALTRCYDLRCPKPKLLQLLATKTGNKENNSPLAGNSSSGGEIISPEKYLAERHVADILRDWKPATLTVEELLSVLRQLQPRLYSISSSPLEDLTITTAAAAGKGGVVKSKGGVANSGAEHRNTVQLTVAVVKYTSKVSGKHRVGVASTYLAERTTHQQQNMLLPSPPPLGQPKLSATVPVYLYKNPDFRLPADLKTPIIMVGPGTGVAPFRGFIQHRILVAAAAAAEKDDADGKEEEGVLGPALLFFGCRKRDQDYLYSTELENWATQGQIQLFTAFSRETDKKVYVQHRLLENSSLVWELLEAGAVFYVCGDGSHMTTDVESALKTIIEEHQQQGATAAVEYFKTMVKNGRYKKDVWVT